MAKAKSYPTLKGLTYGDMAARALDTARLVANQNLGVHYNLYAAGPRDPSLPFPKQANCSMAAHYWQGRDYFDGTTFWNTTAMVRAARAGRDGWYICDPFPGALVAFPGIDVNGDKERDRVGHVKMIVACFGKPEDWDGDFTKLITVECHPESKPGMAVVLGTAANMADRHKFTWRGKKYENHEWGSIVFTRELGM